VNFIILFDPKNFLIVNFSEFIMAGNNIKPKRKLSPNSTISYKNVNLLRRYINNTRKIIPRRDRTDKFKKPITHTNYRIITKCIRRSRRLRLIPYTENSKRGKNFLFFANKNYEIFQYLQMIFHMKDFIKYLSTAPVITFASLTFVLGLLIELNRFFPDLL
jgi:ribosomal protein S18